MNEGVKKDRVRYVITVLLLPTPVFFALLDYLISHMYGDMGPAFETWNFTGPSA
ncbi:hypothetical protein ASPWEDRAFT_36653 [Aspergillus wentii DTO 134E9]|uniref:Uncharacterized protein n=1 Tax=Aspergillus wentii DTO 134E9 TaxID=1073089 RepID=A0A1L9RVK9_ASPWE|nr:uncharacterized protein ASPWEDRAFT_36653 [Aspergillus wentii DTO 134E9]OJJ38952.1 hypothetical protein ASPWEDRAFT_36653 [Aspergillus wentii DTO 134E9]